MIKSLPSQAYLLECFDYNPTTGELRWRERPLAHFRADLSGRSTETNHRKWNALYATKQAGNTKGRSHVPVDGRYFQRARIVWKLVYGSEPPPIIDHINHDVADDRIANLRAATYAENGWNTPVRRTNKVGLKGVSRRGDRWQVQIRCGNTRHHLGVFDTPEEAYAARCEAAKRLHGEFANG